MIDIVMEGMCKDCPLAEIEVRKMFANNEKILLEAVCVHELACSRIKRTYGNYCEASPVNKPCDG